MSGHTPGPWSVEPLDGRKYYGTNVRLSDNASLTVWGSRVWKPSERELEQWGERPSDETEQEWLGNMMCDGHYEDERDLANAYLIAAAPDLLEALKLALYKLDVSHPEFQRTLAVVSDAIAKAEGR